MTEKTKQTNRIKKLPYCFSAAKKITIIITKKKKERKKERRREKGEMSSMTIWKPKKYRISQSKLRNSLMIKSELKPQI